MFRQVNTLSIRRLAARSFTLLHTTPVQRGHTTGATPGKVRVKVRDAAGHVQESLYPCGASLMNAIRDDPTTLADMQGSCDGKLECSTCHVYVEGKWGPLLETLVPRSEKEDDVLDKALGAREESRLACQLILSAEMDGLEVAMPTATRDARFEQFVSRTLDGQSRK